MNTKQSLLQKKRLSALAKANTAKAIKKVEADYQAKLQKIQESSLSQSGEGKSQIINTEVPQLVAKELEKAKAGFN